MIAFLASSIFIPAYFPAFSFIVPSLFIETFNGSLCFFHHSTSLESPKVQTITAPVPNSKSTSSSAIIGTSKLYSGTIACFPTKCFLFSSVGFTKTATQEGSNSGRVVAISSSSPVSFTLNFK